MKVILQTLAAGIMCTASAVTIADQHGGKGSSLLCALTNTVACDNQDDCQKGPATAVNLPVFMLFHPDQMVVESAKQGGERRTSKIASIGGKGDIVILLGDDESSGWGVRINKATGNLTGAVVTDGVGYLIFGSCLAR